MKKIITTLSAITLTLPSGAAKSEDTNTVELSQNEMQFLYDNEITFRGSGFVDLSVEKTVWLSKDADLSGDITLGDELTYLVQIDNLSNFAASGVVLIDNLDSRLELNLGTVAITQGAVLSGNNIFDETDLVYVDFDTIAANWFAMAYFDVTVTNLRPGLNEIANTASVFGPSGSFFISDDPTTPLFDPTYANAYGAYPDLIFVDGFEFSGSGGF